MNRLRFLAAALVSCALPLGAQGILQSIVDATAIVGPQYQQYKFTTPGTEKTVSQFSVPIAVIVPFSETFSMDISTSYANSQVRFAGATTSQISGLTDTQVRGNLVIGDNRAIITLGLNLPTGMYKVPDGQVEAAGQIGNDFLIYPVASMGSGLSTTGGVAYAQPIGDWNLGLGASFRYSSPFDAYKLATASLRFQPGNEMKVRVGIDRPIADGNFSIGVTYSKFGKDLADSTTFATGDRVIGSANLYLPLGNGDFTLAAWNMYRAQGERIGAVAPWENLFDVSTAVGFNVGGMYVQPSVEGRVWQVDGLHTGTIGTVGLRLRFGMGALSVNPSAGYTLGKLYASTGDVTDVTGLHGQILFRLH